MPFISRQYIFANGTESDANQINAELDTIHTAINGNLTAENLKDNSISKVKLNFALASPKYRGDVPTPADLSTITTPAHMDVATVSNDMDMYAYDGVSLIWKKISGTVATVSHSTLTGRTSADSHPISAITGLETRLSTIEGEVNTNDSTVSAHTTTIADHEGRIDSNEAEIQSLNGSVGTLTTNLGTANTNIGTLQTDVNTLKGKTSVLPYAQTFESQANQTLAVGVYTKLALGTQSGANFDSTNQVYKAPVQGRYRFEVNLSFQDLGTAVNTIYIRFCKNAETPVQGKILARTGTATSVNSFLATSDNLDLNAGDTVYFSVYCEKGGTIVGSWSRMSVQLIQKGPQVIPVFV